MTMDWQPIETAPRDGTRIILTDGKSVEAGCFAPHVHGDEYAWAFVDDYAAEDVGHGNVGVQANAFKTDFVTHWMPLPGAPKMTLEHTRNMQNIGPDCANTEGAA